MGGIAYFYSYVLCKVSCTEVKINTILSVFLNTDIFSLHSGRLNALLFEIGFKSKLTTLLSILKDISTFDDIKDLFPEKNHGYGEKIMIEVKSLIETLRDVEKSSYIRNRYVHSHWIDGGICGPSGTVARYKITAKGKGVKGSLEFETVSSLEEYSLFIKNTGNKLNENSELISVFSFKEKKPDDLEYVQED